MRNRDSPAIRRDRARSARPKRNGLPGFIGTSPQIGLRVDRTQGRLHPDLVRPPKPAENDQGHRSRRPSRNALSIESRRPDNAERLRPRATFFHEARNNTELLSKICPGQASRPAPLTHHPWKRSPPDLAAHVHFGESSPRASRASVCEVNQCPGLNNPLPSRSESQPRRRTNSPASTCVFTKTSVPSRSRTSSCITTASAPAGIGAPVKTRIASPGSIGTPLAIYSRRLLPN